MAEISHPSPEFKSQKVMSTPSAGSTSSTTTPAATNNGSMTAPSKPVAQLLPLEEDDEFEEFPAEDWDDSQTFAASLSSKDGSNKEGNVGKQGLDSLWEDNWDDDDVGDDFAVQLRGELVKQDQMQA